MTTWIWPAVVVAQALTYIGVSLWQGRVARRRLLAAMTQRNELMPCALFCLAMGHPTSPAPDEVKEQANAFVPEWVRASTQTTVLGAAFAADHMAMPHSGRTH